MQLAMLADELGGIALDVCHLLLLLPLLGAQGVQSGFHLPAGIRFFLFLFLENVHFLEHVLGSISQRRVDALEGLVFFSQLIPELLHFLGHCDAIGRHLAGGIVQGGLQLRRSGLRDRLRLRADSHFLLHGCNLLTCVLLGSHDVRVSLGDFLEHRVEGLLQLFLTATWIELQCLGGAAHQYLLADRKVLPNFQLQFYWCLIHIVTLWHGRNFGGRIVVQKRPRVEPLPLQFVAARCEGARRLSAALGTKYKRLILGLIGNRVQIIMAFGQ
jgi:hypothetical protein